MQTEVALVPAAGPAPGTMPLGWRVSAMGNGECSPASQPTLRGTLAAPSVYWRVWGTMRQWRGQWRTEIYRSASLRGSDA